MSFYVHVFTALAEDFFMYILKYVRVVQHVACVEKHVILKNQLVDT